MNKLHEHKDEILDLLKHFHDAAPQLHSAVVFWYSPAMNIVCHRNGWFDDFMEAELFGKKVFEEETGIGSEAVLYLDGEYTQYHAMTSFSPKGGRK